MNDEEYLQIISNLPDRLERISLSGGKQLANKK
jgi:hypothetical protein